jgi:protein-tyrosine kinase
MGRTYEALSRGRVKRSAAADEDEIPPTVVIPSFHATPLETAPGEAGIESDCTTADTALLDELARDDDTVPFIEVGGPKGSPPRYGPQVASTPVANSVKLRLDAPTPEVPTKLADDVAVAFFPLPERPPLDSGQIAAELVAFHRSTNSVGAQYRAVLAGIAAQHPGVGCPLLVFTTVCHAVEAATVILNIAITRAREESKRLLVIEANHDRPLIARRLGIAPKPGMRELLSRSIPMSVALHRTAQEHLYALPPGDAELPVSNEAESRLPDVVNQLRKRFDWLLVNGPEWGSGGAVEWATLGDAAYLVVHQDQWDTPEVEAAHEAIIDAGGKLRGYITLQTN